MLRPACTRDHSLTEDLVKMRKKKDVDAALATENGIRAFEEKDYRSAVSALGKVWEALRHHQALSGEELETMVKYLRALVAVDEMQSISHAPSLAASLLTKVDLAQHPADAVHVVFAASCLSPTLLEVLMSLLLSIMIINLL